MPYANIVCKTWNKDRSELATDEQMKEVLGYNHQSMTRREQATKINEIIKETGYTIGCIGHGEYIRDNHKGDLIKTTIKQTVKWITDNFRGQM